MAEQLVNQETADKAFRANCSPRYLRLENFEKYVEGRQYDGKPSWWSDDQPLWDRAPCIVYPVVDIASSSYVDLLFGEGRFPQFTTKPSEDESDEENGLSPEDSKKVDRFIREWHRICRFRSVSRDLLRSAQGCGSAAEIHGVRGGKPFVDLVPAKWCEPTLGQEGEVQKLVIEYPFQETYQERDGKWAVRTKLYRRVIDDKRDVEYKPADAKEDGIKPNWQENPDRTVEHGLGFCPVIWYPYMLGCVPVNVVDGKPIHANVLDEIHAHDIARSQWHRGALFSEPQIFEVGVTPGFSPTDVGVTPLVLTSEEHGLNEKSARAQGKITGAIVDPGERKKARKKGPGYPWQYPNHETKVGAIFYPGDALEAQENNCRDLRIKLQESLAVVFLDPESIKFAATTSGKALEAIKQKQIDRCGQIRDDLDERYLTPSVSLQLRIAQKILGNSKAKLKVPGATKVKPLLDKFASDGDWQIPTLQTIWGDYFKPDPAEQKVIVDMVIAALDAGIPLLTLKIALQKLAPIFGIENVAAFESELVKEHEARRAQAQEDAELEQEALHDLARATAGEEPRRNRGRGRGKSPAASGGGSGSASASAATT